MDFVDEEHIALTQIGEGTDEIGRLFQGGTRRRGKVHPKFAGHQVGESRLAKARRAKKERVIQRFLARAGGRDRDAEAILDFLLADELDQSLGAKGQLDDALVGDGFRRGNFGAAHTAEYTVATGHELSNRGYYHER